MFLFWLSLTIRPSVELHWSLFPLWFLWKAGACFGSKLCFSHCGAPQLDLHGDSLRRKEPCRGDLIGSALSLPALFPTFAAEVCFYLKHPFSFRALCFYFSLNKSDQIIPLLHSALEIISSLGVRASAKSLPSQLTDDDIDSTRSPAGGLGSDFHPVCRDTD